jgi:hypothetical protein
MCKKNCQNLVYIILIRGEFSVNKNIKLIRIGQGSGSARIRAELETIIEEEGLREYTRVYTDDSVMDERSGCAIVMGQREVK